MRRDVRLYRESVAAAGTPAALGAALDAVIQDFAAAMPAADFTRLYPYIAGEQDDG